MGVDIGTYHTRNGSFVANYTRKNTMGGWKVEMDGWQTWGYMLMVMLVIGGVEANLGLPVEQEKIYKILTHMQNQEKEFKVIKHLLESHNQEMAEMKKGTNVLRLKSEKVTEVIDKVISDYKEIKQSVRHWEERQDMVNEKVKWSEDGHRKKEYTDFWVGGEERGELLRHIRSCEEVSEGDYENGGTKRKC
jgi:hypothetical protein